MRINYEEKEVEIKEIKDLSYGDSFTVANDYIEDEDPVVLMLIEPNFGLAGDYDYGVGVENGEMYRFKPTTKVIAIRTQLNIKKP